MKQALSHTAAWFAMLVERIQYLDGKDEYLAVNGLHLTTDPACTQHRPPTGWLSTWIYNNKRGYSCPICMKGGG
jgi:hypothetical protein